ncbi:MAG: sugar transferase, partial [Boseongicola sp. SB0677_bin_26]|nr:sugar transferase [Boseongicola sp. SB0677_bin_26]
MEGAQRLAGGGGLERACLDGGAGAGGRPALRGACRRCRRVMSGRAGIDGRASGRLRDAAPAASGAYKRPFDLVLLGLALVLLAPLWAVFVPVVALAVRLEDGGPVLYRQARLGRGGAMFEILKFRTMAVAAEAETGPVWTERGDARITRVGHVLRRFHLDELPQAVNVLRGEMSLVGPRPERPELAARIAREVPGFHARLRVRPGVAGLA